MQQYKNHKILKVLHVDAPYSLKINHPEKMILA